MIRITSIVTAVLAVGAAIGLVVVGYRGESLTLPGGLLGAALVAGLAWVGFLTAASWIELIHIVLEMDARLRDRRNERRP